MNKDIKHLEEVYNIKIPDERIKSWQIQLDMWKRFDNVCKSHNLNYYIMFGALLGAVRHKGFIPWDDDIDVVMMRTDYDKLIKYVNEFEYPYFLQIPENSGNSDYSNLLVIYEKSSCIDKRIISKEQRQGIKLDIVPLDPLPNNRFIYNYIKFVFKLLKTITYVSVCDFKKINKKGKAVAIFSKIFFIFVKRYKIPYMLENIRKRTYRDSKKIGEIGHGFVFDQSDFEQTVFLDFEGYKMPAPGGYDNILRELYGDYMSLPKVNDRQQSAYESNMYYTSPYVSYIDYFKNKDL